MTLKKTIKERIMPVVAAGVVAGASGAALSSTGLAGEANESVSEEQTLGASEMVNPMDGGALTPIPMSEQIDFLNKRLDVVFEVLNKIPEARSLLQDIEKRDFPMLQGAQTLGASEMAGTLGAQNLGSELPATLDGGLENQGVNIPDMKTLDTKAQEQKATGIPSLAELSALIQKGR